MVHRMLLLICSAVLAGCITQDDPTLSLSDGNAPFASGAALQCSLEDSGKARCFPYRVTRSSRGDALLEVTYMGPTQSMMVEGVLFHQLPVRRDDRYTLEVAVKTGQGYKFVPALGWMTRADSMEILVPRCYDLKEQVPEVGNLMRQGVITDECTSKNQNDRYRFLLALTAAPKDALLKASAVQRMTTVSMAVAQERQRTIALESAAADAKSELTLNIERTAAREYVAAFPARAQLQSYSEIYYGAPFIGTLFAMNFSATNVKCSAVKNDRTTCSWAHNVKVQAASPLWASLAWNAPLMKDEILTREFVFVNGKWTSPGLRALYASRDAPASVGVSSGSGKDAFEELQETRRRTSCANAMLSNSSLGMGFNC